MVTALKQFIQEQAPKQRKAKADIDEWRKAIERLFSQVKDWLKEADPDGLIDVEEGEEDVNEPGLGRYRVPRLDLRAFGKWIGIVPKARRTVGSAKPPRTSAPARAEGRVDITDELKRYVLYRFREEGRDVWLMEDLTLLVRTEPKLFAQEDFEQALLSYFR